MKIDSNFIKIEPDIIFAVISTLAAAIGFMFKIHISRDNKRYEDCIAERKMLLERILDIENRLDQMGCKKASSCQERILLNNFE